MAALRAALGHARAASLALLAAALVAAMPSRAEVAVVDDAGSRVVLAAPARRIVALAPHVTELVFAAGAGASLAGVVAGSDYPPAARALPVVGDANAIDLERVLALSPDLVVTWPYTTSAQLDALRRHGIVVFTSDARTIDGIATDIERIGVLAGTSEAARATAARFRAELDAARVRRAGPPLRVFYEVWGEPIYTVGGTQLISEAIALCGGVNVFASSLVPAPMVDVEAVIAADPQVIVAGVERGKRPQWLDTWRRWPQIAAVAAGALRTVDADLLHRPGPRFAHGVAELCRAIGA